MLRRLKELEESVREGIRGGEGRGFHREYFGPDEMAGVRAVGRVALEPGASVGPHGHPAEEELYVILEGCGVGEVDGEEFPVAPGDAFLCKAGHSHGLKNAGPGRLVFLAVMVPALATGPTGRR